jgi:hypothetical protein
VSCKLLGGQRTPENYPGIWDLDVEMSRPPGSLVLDGGWHLSRT